MTIKLGNRIPVMLRPTEQRINGLAVILARHTVGGKGARRAAELLVRTGDVLAALTDIGRSPWDPDIRQEIAAEIEAEVQAALKEREERETDAMIDAFFSLVGEK